MDNDFQLSPRTLQIMHEFHPFAFTHTAATVRYEKLEDEQDGVIHLVESGDHIREFAQEVLRP